MRTLRLTLCFAILPLCVAGCAATSGVAPKMRTIASVGGRPLPVVTGEPGATVVADRPPPPRTLRRDARISGRVFDDRGEPVPDARVRLAVGNAPGGRMIGATTDSTGAFTLRGVRPGSSYTVIAEWEDEQGSVTGRSVVEAPNTNVRITLGVSDRDSSDTTRSARTKRVNPVSEREEPSNDDDFADESSGIPRVNEEDLPPATEAEALLPAKRSRSMATSNRDTTPRVARWRRAPGERRTPDPTEERPESPAPQDPDARETGASPATAGAEPDDDGPNPLPPAINRDQTSQAPAALPDAVVAEADNPPAVPDTLPPATPDAVPAALVSDPFETTQTSTEPDRSKAPRRRPATPAAVVADQDAFDAPPPAEITPPPTPGALVAAPPISDQSVFETESQQPVSPSSLPTPEPPPPDTRKRTKWKDLTTSAPAAPALAAQEIAPAGYPMDALPKPVEASTAEPRAPRASPSASPPPPPRDAGLAFCDYDAKLRRIKEFRLPDLEGRPVRFQDLDADLVLIDFWGTWCQPCLRSIPHLVDLQKRFGPAKLKVLGVACEQGPVAERTQKVAQQVRKLGINYPVVMSGMDGPCPLQQALNIQAYPTLILVDRQGRIVWRDQGTTPVTLARLDRFLAMSAKDEGVKRY